MRFAFVAWCGGAESGRSIVNGVRRSPLDAVGRLFCRWPPARERGQRRDHPTDGRGRQHDGRVEIGVRGRNRPAVAVAVVRVRGAIRVAVGRRSAQVSDEHGRTPQRRIPAAGGGGDGLASHERSHRGVQPPADVTSTGAGVVPAAADGPYAVIEQRAVAAGVPDRVQHRPVRLPRYHQRTRSRVVVEKWRYRYVVVFGRPSPYQAVRARVHTATTFRLLDRSDRGHGRRVRLRISRLLLVHRRSRPASAVRAQNVPVRHVVNLSV